MLSGIVVCKRKVVLVQINHFERKKHKSLLNATWKVGVGLFGIAALIVGILIFYVWYDETFGRNYRYDENLSKDIAVHSYNGSARARVWNRRTERYVTPKLRWVAGTPSRDSWKSSFLAPSISTVNVFVRGSSKSRPHRSLHNNREL